MLCTWPRGRRPTLPFPYFNEVWCGVEYQAASHMIYEGLVDEGLAIVRGVRERHDGQRRNPWNEFEYGSHYARSLASWSLLTALSGFSYDMVQGHIGFNPRLPGAEFRTFWSVAWAWGTYRRHHEGGFGRVQLCVEYGSLALRALGTGLGQRSSAGRVTVNNNGVDAEFRQSPTGLIVIFRTEVLLGHGDVLRIELSNDFSQ